MKKMRLMIDERYRCLGFGIYRSHSSLLLLLDFKDDCDSGWIPMEQNETDVEKLMHNFLPHVHFIRLFGDQRLRHSTGPAVHELPEPL